MGVEGRHGETEDEVPAVIDRVRWAYVRLLVVELIVSYLTKRNGNSERMNT